MKRTLLRRQSLWITAFSLLLLGGLVLGIRSTRVADPVHKGRHLSEWMNMVSDDPVLAAHDARSQEAVQVIREMGTNAVPPLLHWIAYEPPVSRYHLAPVCRRLPRWVLARLPPHWFLGNYERERSANKAARVFALLGPEAAPAIPELMRLARIPAGRRYLVEETPGRAMAALAMLGPPRHSVLPIPTLQCKNARVSGLGRHPPPWYQCTTSRAVTHSKPSAHQ